MRFFIPHMCTKNFTSLASFFFCGYSSRTLEKQFFIQHTFNYVNMAPTITVEIPYDRLIKDDCISDEYLINQLDGVNDNPPEDNLPLRKWLIREAHEALMKNHKMKEITLKPKSDKSSHMTFTLKVTGNE